MDKLTELRLRQSRALGHRAEVLGFRSLASMVGKGSERCVAAASAAVLAVGAHGAIAPLTLPAPHGPPDFAA